MKINIGAASFAWEWAFHDMRGEAVTRFTISAPTRATAYDLQLHGDD
ncbi:hypothetical protein GGD83_004651 [Rhodoblastus sphagnicola]|nr:hypothetical protein [Rhodoblastus sphagnicola]MBB4200822.1 hypothetical protein [Rhodoblastus sphagnicola]